MKNTTLFGALLFLCCHLLPAQNTYYVNPQATGQQNGSTWADGFSNLHQALSSAEHGDAIWVKTGTYYTTTTADQSIYYALKSGVQLYGGFAGTETTLAERDWSAHPTILDGDIGVPGDSTDNTHTMMVSFAPDASTVVDGFIFQHGRADGSGEPTVILSGQSTAGIYVGAQNQVARLTVRHCRFVHNYGDGIHVEPDGADAMVSPRIIDCHFTDNYFACGVYRTGSDTLDHKDDLRDCHFLRNHGYEVGYRFTDKNSRTDTMDVINCRFEDNTVINQLFGSTGAFKINGRDNVTNLRFTGCTFIRNTSRFGNCIYFYSAKPLPNLEIDGCVFDNNTSSSTNLSSIFGLAVFISSEYEGGPSSATVAIRNSTFSNMLWAPFEVVGVYPYKEAVFENNIVTRCKKIGGILSDKYIVIRNNLFNGNSEAPGFFSYAGKGEFLNNIFYGNHSYSPNGYTAIPFVLYNGPKAAGNMYINNKFHKKFNAPGANSKSVFNNAVFWNNENILLNQAIIPQFPFSQDTNIFNNCYFDVSDCTEVPSLTPCAGSGNIYMTDPMLTDTAGLDFRPLPCSPLINAGSNLPFDTLQALLDLLGHPRISDGIVDIGAIETLPLFSSTGPVVQPSCQQAATGSVALTLDNACEPLALQWTSANGQTGSNNNNLSPGNYTFSLTDQRGKVFEQQVIVPAVATPNVSANTTSSSCSTCANGSIELLTTGINLTFVWSNGSTAQNQSNLMPGTYTVTIHDEAGCAYEQQYQVTYISGNNDLENPGGFKFSPNPASTHFTLTLPEGMHDAQLSILDLQGRVLREENITGSSQQVSTEGLNNGTYFLRLSGEVTGVQKLIILR